MTNREVLRKLVNDRNMVIVDSLNTIVALEKLIAKERETLAFQREKLLRAQNLLKQENVSVDDMIDA